jgi:hypothetical protein
MHRVKNGLPAAVTPNAPLLLPRGTASTVPHTHLTPRRDGVRVCTYLYTGRPHVSRRTGDRVLPVCPSYSLAYLASAPSSAFIISSHPIYNPYEHIFYASSGSSRPASSDPPMPTVGHARRPKPPPTTFDITIPKTGRSVSVMFVQRVTHVTTPVKYGIAPLALTNISR